MSVSLFWPQDVLVSALYNFTVLYAFVFVYFMFSAKVSLGSRVRPRIFGKGLVAIILLFMDRLTDFEHSAGSRSPFLLSYLHRIDPTNNPSPNCPLCKVAEHNTTHIFNCPHLPTALDPDCLRSNLAEAAALLDRWMAALARVQYTCFPRGRDNNNNLCKIFSKRPIYLKTMNFI